jgi:hypothetical protein
VLCSIDRFCVGTLLTGFYGTLAYLLSLSFVETPLLFLVVLCYGAVSYWLVGLEPSASRFMFFFATIFLVINVGFAVAQAISAAYVPALAADLL